MAITSVQDGNWNTGSTWSGGSVPTANSDVVIKHKVTISTDAVAGLITISTGGSLVTDDTWHGINPISLTVARIVMTRELTDDRVVRLDGVNLIVARPSITASGSSTFPDTTAGVKSSTDEVIIDDPGLYGFSAQMQDIKPEGCARAYARKVSNGVRYLNVIVHIRKDRTNIIGQLYRLAENPFQVLAVTNSAVIKGYIEAITPIDSVGKEYRSFRVSIAEGL